MNQDNVLKALDNTQMMLDMFKRKALIDHETLMMFIGEIEDQLLRTRQQLCDK